MFGFVQMSMEQNILPSSQLENDSEKKRKKPSRSSFFATVLIFSIFISSFFGAVFGFISGGLGQKIISQRFPYLANKVSYSSSNSNVTKEQITQEDSAVVDVVKKATPAVVSIVITKDVPKMKSFFDFPGFFDPFGNSGGSSSGSTEKQQVGGGTGFFITSDGMIVTNKHVVSDTTADYTVISNDKKEYSAKVLARDPVNDVAVIKIEGKDFPTLELGDSDVLSAGQTVIAIGNSLGEFTNTVSRGIISGLRRNLTAGSTFGEAEKLTNIIQTDAAINPGNSGGPLINISGQVIGINVAMAQGAQNIGFAIPSNQIKKITSQVQATGKISTPFLGIRYTPIDKDIQEANNLPYDYGIIVARGAKITDLAVIPGSPADKAGIVENDIILEVDGKKLDENTNFAQIISQYNVGDEIALKVWHKGGINEVSIKLEERI
jgi:serine protease Do